MSTEYEKFCGKCDHKLDHGLCEEAACPCVCVERGKEL